jgi:sulfatase maturation enzyme AslB (radical SAM superfamily)
LEKFFKNTESIDLYVNYVCGLRCTHCFVGDLLNTNLEMPISLALAIVEECAKSGVKTITILGGEPTLYKDIIQLINLIIEKNIEVRIVTNAQKSFYKMVEKLSPEILTKLHVCFSIDGSSDEIHNAIRGKGTFQNLMKGLRISKKHNISASAIASISMDNYFDTLSIIDFCFSNKMKYLNIHYVTDRGFAEKNKVVSVNDWLKLCKKIKESSFKINVRLEKTFVPEIADVHCEVIEKKNYIIDPRGKVFGCTMFMNFKHMESGTLTTNGFIINENRNNENSVCACTNRGCPAMPLINEELVSLARNEQLKFDCIFNKTKLFF